jgi:hyperosmotically inducible periplasmic protein
MINTRIRVSAFALATALIAWAGPAQAQQGPVGQGLNEAGRAVKRGFQTAGQAVSNGFQKTKNTVHNMEVVSRVYSRLHWDKALTNATMEIEVQAGGIAILSGAVPSEEARTKALTLTSETVGVNQVVDHLTIAAITKPAPVVTGTPSTIVSSPSTIIVTPPATTKPKDTDTPL